MGLIQAKQIEKYLIASIGITGFTSSATSTDDITTVLTEVLTTAGNRGVPVPLQVGSATAEGVATSVSYNKCQIYLNGVGLDRLRDVNDNEVYAKITHPSADVWRLDYYTTSNNGVEAAYTFAVATTISIELPYWFTFDNLPADSLVPATERRGSVSSVPLSHLHTQSQPAAEWVIAHNLGRMPHVTLIDSAHDMVSSNVHYPDLHTVIVNFTWPTSGWAQLT